MTLHQLRVFVSVARHLNLTKASEELHITQPTVSNELKRLEEDCRVAFHRKFGRGIELTEEGINFLKDAEALLFQAEQLKRKYGANFAKKDGGYLTVGASHGPSGVLLPSVLALFRRKQPEVEISLRANDSHSIEQLVLKSEVDIALVTAPSYNPRLIAEPFRKEKNVIFASAKHPLARRELTLAELASAPLILRRGRRGRGGIHKILNQLEKEGLKANIVMRCESTEGVKTQVRMGVGLGILYQDLVESDLRTGEFKAVRVPKLDLNGQSFIIYRKERPLSGNATEFLRLLRAWRHKGSTSEYCSVSRLVGVYRNGLSASSSSI